jgi:hypothetical protein
VLGLERLVGGLIRLVLDNGHAGFPLDRWWSFRRQ